MISQACERSNVKQTTPASFAATGSKKRQTWLLNDMFAWQKSYRWKHCLLIYCEIKNTVEWLANSTDKLKWTSSKWHNKWHSCVKTDIQTSCELWWREDQWHAFCDHLPIHCRWVNLFASSSAYMAEGCVHPVVLVQLHLFLLFFRNRCFSAFYFSVKQCSSHFLYWKRIRRRARQLLFFFHLNYINVVGF